MHVFKVALKQNALCDTLQLFRCISGSVHSGEFDGAVQVSWMEFYTLQDGPDVRPCTRALTHSVLVPYTHCCRRFSFQCSIVVLI